MKTSSDSKRIGSLSVVIVNFNSKRYLERCIASLYGSTKDRLGLEVIVINNDKRESLDFLKELFPKVRMLDNWENKGLAASWNLGRSVSQGDLLWFLNPDTEILADNIDKIASEFESDPDLAVVGPRLVDKSGSVQEWGAGRKVSLSDIILNNLGVIRSRKVWESERKILVDWVSGAAIFVRKDHFDLVGGFDEDFFLYFEDVDFCQRIRNNGKKVAYFPEFKVRHLCGGSHQDQNKQKTAYFSSQDLYFKKHLGFLRTKIMKILRRIFV